MGAGKTTLIRKLIAQAYQGEKLVLIENEFGEIGIDGGFLKEAGIQITEMNSGCICCSLVGNFQQALTDVIEKYAPTRVLIEPSGVGKLSDVIAAVQAVADKNPDIQMGGFITVADANKVKMYTKNFGEFYNDQIQKAQVIVLEPYRRNFSGKAGNCFRASSQPKCRSCHHYHTMGTIGRTADFGSRQTPRTLGTRDGSGGDLWSPSSPP